MSPDTSGDLGTVLGIWAHPDDEAYLSAGLMMRAVADRQSGGLRDRNQRRGGLSGRQRTVRRTSVRRSVRPNWQPAWVFSE